MPYIDSLHFTADFPFRQPLLVEITQTIPSTVSMTNPSSQMLSNGEIVWHQIIPPRETIFRDYEFEYLDAIKEKANVPSVSLSFYIPVYGPTSHWGYPSIVL